MPKLSSDQLKKLRTMHRKVHTEQVESALSRAELDVYIAGLFNAHDQMPGVRICIDCGCFHDARVKCSCA